ncbi:hypothetical protein D1007_33110 [Hordeum vulgare]|nr:hypothetical protein D1007_33110 [Hordeum vulgare]
MHPIRYKWICMLRPANDDRPAGAEQSVGVPPGEAVPPPHRHMLLLLDPLQHAGERFGVAGQLEGTCVRVPERLLGLLKQCLEERVVQALHPHHEPLPARADVHREAALRWLVAPRCGAPAPVQRLGDQPGLPRRRPLFSHAHGALNFAGYS